MLSFGTSPIPRKMIDGSSMVSVGMNGLNKVKINGIDPLPQTGERISIFFCRQEKTIDEKGEMQNNANAG